jgi:hypothetical protein
VTSVELRLMVLHMTRVGMTTPVTKSPEELTCPAVLSLADTWTSLLLVSHLLGCFLSVGSRLSPLPVRVPMQVMRLHCAGEYNPFIYPDPLPCVAGSTPQRPEGAAMTAVSLAA